MEKERGGGGGVNPPSTLAAGQAKQLMMPPPYRKPRAHPSPRSLPGRNIRTALKRTAKSIRMIWHAPSCLDRTLAEDSKKALVLI